MKEKDIRVFGYYEYDFSSYKPETFDKAVALFNEYMLIKNELDFMSENFSDAWIDSDEDKYNKHTNKLKELVKRMLTIDFEIRELDEDPWNHKGFFFRKIYYPIEEFLSEILFNKWFNLIFAILFVIKTIQAVKEDASTLKICLLSIVTIVFAWQFYDAMRPEKDELKEQS